jgi:hypothetical protein
LSSFSETLGSSCVGTATYALSLDKVVYYYWTGAAWAISNGTVGQSNVAASISAQISSFATSVGTGTLYVKAHLNSTGSAACEIDQIQIDGKN